MSRDMDHCAMESNLIEIVAQFDKALDNILFLTFVGVSDLYFRAFFN